MFALLASGRTSLSWGDIHCLLQNCFGESSKRSARNYRWPRSSKRLLLKNRPPCFATAVLFDGRPQLLQFSLLGLVHPSSALASVLALSSGL